MAFRVIVVPTAQIDLEEIIAWVAERSPTGAARLLAQFHSALAALAQNPHAHGLAPESETVRRTVRQALFRTRRGRTYRALFDLQDDVVRVLRIRGSGQAQVRADEL